MEYIIYTDGACSGNPGPGGWGAVIFDQKKISFLASVIIILLFYLNDSEKLIFGGGVLLKLSEITQFSFILLR